MDHMEFAATESASLQVTDWDRWIAKAERLIGHSLDGDDSIAAIHEERACGYSLDEAKDAFENGVQPAAYVSMVATRERYRKPA
jgi:hypothetical protein